ncbi:MAG TPA: hypothetical protein VKP30_29760, partial [Polyangiaceae bacterium]|nr:hypothetical protein [Polyangiaceae bacterium]
MSTSRPKLSRNVPSDQTLAVMLMLPTTAPALPELAPPKLVLALRAARQWEEQPTVPALGRKNSTRCLHSTQEFDPR